NLMDALDNALVERLWSGPPSDEGIDMDVDDEDSVDNVDPVEAEVEDDYEEAEEGLSLEDLSDFEPEPTPAPQASAFNRVAANITTIKPLVDEHQSHVDQIKEC